MVDFVVDFTLWHWQCQTWKLETQLLPKWSAKILCFAWNKIYFPIFYHWHLYGIFQQTNNHSASSMSYPRRSSILQNSETQSAQNSGENSKKTSLTDIAKTGSKSNERISDAGFQEQVLAKLTAATLSSSDDRASVHDQNLQELNFYYGIGMYFPWNQLLIN